jgi:hypothetical protein
MSRSFEDLLARIEEQNDADEAERVLAMDDAQIDAELVAGGLDAAAVRAKGREIGQRALGRAASRARRMHAAKVAGAVAVVAAVVAALALLWARGRRATAPAPILPDEGTSAPRQPTPSELRLEALRACDQRDWKACEQKLDDARRLDPAGETDPAVMELRDRVQRGLHPEPAPDESKPSRPIRDMPIPRAPHRGLHPETPPK